MADALIALPFGLAIGLVVGSVGGGGAILALPVLVYVLGEGVGPASTASLIVVAVAATVGAGALALRGHVCWRLALSFAVPAAVGSLAGTLAGAAVSPRALVLVFVPVMLVAAGATWRRASGDDPDEEEGGCPEARWSRLLAAPTRVPPPMIYDDDADLSLLQDKTVAILGYGSQGHAHALNLKDSGVDVVVGLREGSESVEKAKGDGLRVESVADAASEGDAVMILLPDEKQKAIWESDIADGIAPGNLLLFAHGFSIHFDQIDPGPEVDIGMVAPKGPGHLVRRQYEAGEGVPGLMAVHRDATGNARDLVLAYAKGIGCTRAGVIETSFKDETETDLFGEQAVLCGGMTELVRAGYETLVDAGYDPRLAYFECLHEIKLIVDLMYEKGISGMRYSISNTAEYGDLTRGKKVITDETREAMKKILGDIQSGDFAREWIAENEAGQENFQRMRKEGQDHQIEREGHELRSKMDWIDQEF